MTSLTDKEHERLSSRAPEMQRQSNCLAFHLDNSLSELFRCPEAQASTFLCNFSSTNKDVRPCSSRVIVKAFPRGVHSLSFIPLTIFRFRAAKSFSFNPRVKECKLTPSLSYTRTLCSPIQNLLVPTRLC